MAFGRAPVDGRIAKGEHDARSGDSDQGFNVESHVDFVRRDPAHQLERFHARVPGLRHAQRRADRAYHAQHHGFIGLSTPAYHHADCGVAQSHQAARWVDAGFAPLLWALCMVSHSLREFCRLNSSRGFVSSRMD